MQELRIRSIVKAISYRITGTVTTFIITFAVTSQFNIALSIGVADVICKSIVFYFHERLWNKIKLGKIPEEFDYRI